MYAEVFGVKYTDVFNFEMHEEVRYTLDKPNITKY